MPGTVAGLALAHERYGSGKFTLAQLIAPAIKFAREGFEVDDELADTLPRAQPRLARWPAAAKIFLKSDGEALGRGESLVQTDLANSLETTAADGPRAFYEGPVAEKILAGIRTNGGLMTAEDLKNYRAIVRPARRLQCRHRPRSTSLLRRTARPTRGRSRPDPRHSRSPVRGCARRRVSPSR